MMKTKRGRWKGRPPLSKEEKERRTAQGERLRAARIENGYTQRELAELVDVPKSMVSCSELGDRPMPKPLVEWLESAS